MSDGRKSSPVYPRAQGPDDYALLLLDPHNARTPSSAPGSSLLDTNVVRNIRDYWRNPLSQSGVAKDRLEQLRNGPPLGAVNALWGCGERAWQRHTRTMRGDAFFEHLVAVTDFFDPAVTDLEEKSAADIAARIGPLLHLGEAFENIFKQVAEDELEPAFCVVLKVHELRRTSGPSEDSALAFADWLSVTLDWAPALEMMLGTAILSPPAILTRDGRTLRSAATALFKTDNNPDHVARDAWGAAWDLAFLRVRRRMEQLSPAVLTNDTSAALPYRLISNEAALINAFDAITQVPTLEDLATVASPPPAPLGGFVTAPWLEPNSRLSDRLAGFAMERARAMLSRESIAAGTNSRRAVTAELGRLQAIYADEWPPGNHR